MEFSNASLAAYPLTLTDAALLAVGGASAAVVHWLMRASASRGLVLDYFRWGAVSAIGFSFLGARELVVSGSASGMIGAAVFGFVGGLGGRMTIRYVTDRLSE